MEQANQTTLSDAANLMMKNNKAVIMNCLDMALDLIERDLSIIPVRQNDKRPIVGFKWQEFQQRIATSEEVEAWFERWPDANIALVTGSVSGLWALDADGPRGTDYMRDHCPRTSIYQMTPGGGYHAIYRLPRGKVVHNAVRIMPELDVRGEGGYIVIAPSSINGRPYQLHYVEGFNDWEDLEEWAWEPPEKKGNLADIDMSQFNEPVETERPVAQGSRNNELARVAGLYFQKGLKPSAVMVLCEDWNSKYCQPPLGQGELRTTVESIGKRHVINHPENVDRPNLKVMVPDKNDDEGEIPSEILNPGGLLEQIMDYIDDSSAASFPMFNLAAAATLLGALAGQRVMTETKLRTNLYTICLGYSGCGKDAPQGAISALLHDSNAVGVHGPTSITSAPSIMSWMAEPDGSKASCLLLLDEIGLILGGMRDPRSPAAQVPQLLMELFSSTARKKVKAYADRRNTYVMSWHHLALYGASTPNRFWEAMSSAMAMDGFLARLLIFESRHESPMPKFETRHDVPRGLVDAISEVFNIEVERTGGNLEMGGIPQPHMIGKSQEAAHIFLPWAEAYHDLKNEYRESEDARSPIYGRAAEHASKLALIHALSRCGACILGERVEVEDVHWAMGLMDYLIPHTVRMATENIADDEWAAHGKRLMALIRKKATLERPGLTRAEMMKSTSMEKITFDRVIATLRAAENVVEIDWQNPKGGPKTKLLCLAATEPLN